MGAMEGLHTVETVAGDLPPALDGSMGVGSGRLAQQTRRLMVALVSRHIRRYASAIEKAII